MKKHILILSLFLLALNDQIQKEDDNNPSKEDNPVKDSQCKIPQTYMNYYGCEVYAGQCSLGYTFIACRQQYCSHYYTSKNKDGTTNTYCIKYDYRYFSEGSCLYQCCGDVGTGLSKFTPQILQECKEENRRLTKRFWYIVLGILVTICAVALCVKVYEECQRKSKRQYIF